VSFSVGLKVAPGSNAVSRSGTHVNGESEELDNIDYPGNRSLLSKISSDKYRLPPYYVRVLSSEFLVFSAKQHGLLRTKLLFTLAIFDSLFAEVQLPVNMSTRKVGILIKYPCLTMRTYFPVVRSIPFELSPTS
jgi:hypothetical protein